MSSNLCLLIVVDGLRPEAIDMAPMPLLASLKSRGALHTTAQSMMPNSTLPCHFSIFHSVPPQRHGITSNTWTPQVRPITGLFESLSTQRKTSAFAYNWEQLRDLAPPGHITASSYHHMKNIGELQSDRPIAEDTIEFIQAGYDFIFCYLGETDEVGHKFGWLSPEYLECAKAADALIGQIFQALPTGSSLIVTANHGGHERTHGTDCPEDMTVPLYIYAPNHKVAPPNRPFTLLDIAPTIAHLTGIEPPAEWEGQSIVIDG